MGSDSRSKTRPQACSPRASFATWRRDCPCKRCCKLSPMRSEWNPKENRIRSVLSLPPLPHCLVPFCTCNIWLIIECLICLSPINSWNLAWYVMKSWSSAYHTTHSLHLCMRRHHHEHSNLKLLSYTPVLWNFVDQRHVLVRRGLVVGIVIEVRFRIQNCECLSVFLSDRHRSMDII